MKTFSLQTDDEELVAAMQKTLGALVEKAPDQWSDYLAIMFKGMELAIKVGDLKHFMHVQGILGIRNQMKKMDLIRAGKLADDCDCIHCKNRRRREAFFDSAAGKETSETFQRYYMHLCSQASHDDKEAVDWETAHAEFESWPADQKLLSSEKAHWPYVKAEREAEEQARREAEGEPEMPS